MDRQHRRLLSACGNNLMIVLDADSGKVVGQAAIGGGVDGAGFDPSTQCAFSSNGEGSLSVVREESPTKFSLVENVPTRRGARTMIVDEKAHRVYLVSAKFGPPPAPTADRPHPRPAMEPEAPCSSSLAANGPVTVGSRRLSRATGNALSWFDLAQNPRC